jgi:hypothetical protein
MSLPIVLDRDRNENLVRSHEKISWLEMLATSVNVIVISLKIARRLWDNLIDSSSLYAFDSPPLLITGAGWTLPEGEFGGTEN